MHSGEPAVIHQEVTAGCQIQDCSAGNWQHWNSWNQHRKKFWTAALRKMFSLLFKEYQKYMPQQNGQKILRVSHYKQCLIIAGIHGLVSTCWLLIKKKNIWVKFLFKNCLSILRKPVLNRALWLAITAVTWLESFWSWVCIGSFLVPASNCVARTLSAQKCVYIGLHVWGFLLLKPTPREAAYMRIINEKRLTMNLCYIHCFG